MCETLSDRIAMALPTASDPEARVTLQRWLEQAVELEERVRQAEERASQLEDAARARGGDDQVPSRGLYGTCEICGAVGAPDRTAVAPEYVCDECVVLPASARLRIERARGAGIGVLLEAPEVALGLVPAGGG